MALANGAPVIFQNSPGFVVVMAGGFLVNALWCIFLSLRNRSIGDYIGRCSVKPKDWGGAADSGPTIGTCPRPQLWLGGDCGRHLVFGIYVLRYWHHLHGPIRFHQLVDPSGVCHCLQHLVWYRHRGVARIRSLNSLAIGGSHRDLGLLDSGHRHRRLGCQSGGRTMTGPEYQFLCLVSGM